MIEGEWRLLWRKRKYADFERGIIPEPRSSVGYGSVGKLEMNYKYRDGERLRLEEDCICRTEQTTIFLVPRLNDSSRPFVIL